MSAWRDREIEAGQIVLGQGGHPQVGARQVDALFRADPCALAGGRGDLGHHPARLQLDHFGAQLAVVDPDRAAFGHRRHQRRMAERGAHPVVFAVFLRRGQRVDNLEQVADLQPLIRAQHLFDAQFRAGQVDLDRHAAPHLGPDPARMADHRSPVLGRIMGAIDPQAIGARGQQRGDQFRALRRLGGQRDHGAGLRIATPRAKQRIAPRGQPGRPRREDLDRRIARLALAPDQRQRGQHRIERGTHMRLGPAQRTEPERGQRCLKRHQIAPPQCQIIGQIARRCHEFRALDQAIPMFQRRLCPARHIAPQHLERPIQPPRLCPPFAGLNLGQTHALLLRATTGRPLPPQRNSSVTVRRHRDYVAVSAHRSEPLHARPPSASRGGIYPGIVSGHIGGV